LALSLFVAESVVASPCKPALSASSKSLSIENMMFNVKSLTYEI
jgi:hypothetical protein